VTGQPGATMDIVVWLRSLGLGRYEAAFRENEIDEQILPSLTQEDLKEIGVGPVGHRRMLLEAIAALCADASNAPTGTVATPSVAPSFSSENHAERRPLTVMICDLVGSTALSGRLDPEDLRGVIGAYHRCCAELVERHGGFVAKYMGDGLLAYFGYPRAHEDDAERAVQAGLGLIEAVPKLNTAASVSLQVRVGIATGLVVVGDLIGAGAAQEQAVVGETPNLAARLQALAEPGAVVISASTRRLTGGLFDYRDLGGVALKGFADSVPAWQALGASAAESRFAALRASTTPLVGRGEEIELLLRRWGQAKGGDGCVVLVSGEPGIGKSRIAETILERLSGEPHIRLRLFCSPHHEDSALYPSITQLERAAGFRRDDTDEQRLAKLEAVLALATNDLGEAVPLLADLLSVPTGGRYPALDLTPQKRKEKTLRALVGQVEGLAVGQPTLLVVEDAHWADPTSRELFDLIVERTPNLPLLAIVTFRPEFAPPWIGRPQVTLISLSRLPHRFRAEMIMHVAGGKTLPKEIADQITDRTDGVPLFIEELTKTVIESGLLVASGDHYLASGPVAPLAIPTSLQASLLARLDRLAPTRDVAQIGAALGRQFSHELISAVAEMPREQLDDALAQLVHAELIFRRGTPPDAEYTFKHALVQDAAYSTLLRSRRQQLHGRIAAILEARFPETVQAQPDVLAQHYAEAGLTDMAVGYWLVAARQSVARWALAEAVTQLRKGLALLVSMPASTARQEQELDLQLTLGQVLIASKGYAAPEPAEAYARARALCDQVDPPRQLISVLDGQMSLALFRGELTLALRIGEEQMRLGETRNDTVWIAMGCIGCGAPSLSLGEFIAARRNFERGLELYDPAQQSLYAALAAEDPQVVMLMCLAGALLPLGYVDQARLRYEAALAEAQRLAHPLSLDWACLAMIGYQTAVGKFETALKSSGDLLALLEKHANWHFWPSAIMLRGRCLAALGQHQAGIELLESGLTAYRASGTALYLPQNLVFAAESYLKARHPEQGLKLIAAAAERIEATGERAPEAWMLCIRGELLVAIDDAVAAEESFRQALAVARRQSARLSELLAALDLARLWRDQGKHAAAREVLRPVYDWFSEGFDTPILRKAKAVLDELS
jgi:predicted ATPase/class 3 adenylate cyclase